MCKDNLLTQARPTHRILKPGKLNGELSDKNTAGRCFIEVKFQFKKEVYVGTIYCSYWYSSICSILQFEAFTIYVHENSNLPERGL